MGSLRQLRAGERRYVLRALLGQDGVATLAWLAQHAERTPAIEFAPIGEYWAGRARSSARLLAAASEPTG